MNQFSGWEKVKIEKKRITGVKRSLRKLPLVIKLILLVSGASLFFLLFPFLLRYGTIIYIAFFSLLLIFGALFRIVTDKGTFKATLWLWGGGSIVYLIIALFMILRGVQPLPYIQFETLPLIIYYLSYPLRVLGIFFIGLIFANITSPAEFLSWGEAGLKIALAYRAFEYSVQTFSETKTALLIQGEWPDFGGVKRQSFREVLTVIRSAPVLIATAFRNIILWFPWAWICYNSLKKEIIRRK
jgi:hypothetical protein